MEDTDFPHGPANEHARDGAGPEIAAADVAAVGRVPAGLVDAAQAQGQGRGQREHAGRDGRTGGGGSKGIKERAVAHTPRLLSKPTLVKLALIIFLVVRIFVDDRS